MLPRVHNAWVRWCGHQCAQFVVGATMPKFVVVGVAVPEFVDVCGGIELLLDAFSSLALAVALSNIVWCFLGRHAGTNSTGCLFSSRQWQRIALAGGFTVSFVEYTNKEKYYQGLMDSFLGLSLKLLVRLLVRWTLRSRTTERTRVIVLGHMTQWGHCKWSYDSMTVVSVPPETNGIGKWPQSLCNEQRPASQSTFSWLLVEASGFLPENPCQDSILLVANPVSVHKERISHT